MLIMSISDRSICRHLRALRTMGGMGRALTVNASAEITENIYIYICIYIYIFKYIYIHMLDGID